MVLRVEGCVTAGGGGGIFLGGGSCLDRGRGGGGGFLGKVACRMGEGREGGVKVGQ